MIDVHPTERDWKLPADATPLPSFHVTLIGRKAFLEQQDAIAEVWDSVRSRLPLAPQPEFRDEVYEATDEDRKTWFLHIVNQDDFRRYLDELTMMR